MLKLSIDEIYFSVNPKKAKNSDTIMIDCHYDTPWYHFVRGGIEIYRVLIACTENKTVETSLPYEDLKVFINKSDFYGLNYNKDFHCVKGTIDDDKVRVVLKIHFIIIPKTYQKNSYNERFIRWIDETWAYGSRYSMNATIAPKTTFERILTNTVVSGRTIFNHMWLSLFFLVMIILLIFYMINKKPKSKK